MNVLDLPYEVYVIPPHLRQPGKPDPICAGQVIHSAWASRPRARLCAIKNNGLVKFNQDSHYLHEKLK